MSEVRREIRSPAPVRGPAGRALASATCKNRARPSVHFLILSLGLVLVALLGTPAPATAAATAEERLENEIKAAFLYQFGGYIDWPDGTFSDEREPLVIGVIGADDVAIPLSHIVRDRMMRGRPVQTRRMEPGQDPGAAHILFIGPDVGAGVAAAVLSRVRGQPVLTVTDTGQGADGIVTFVIEQNRVRFDVSLERAQESGIRISSRLLSVARRVQESRP